MYKVIVSQKKESTLNHWNELLLKRIPSRSYWRQHETLLYFPPTGWSFQVGLNENANSFFATRYCFLSSKNKVFPGNAVHKAALRSQMLLYQASQARLNENEIDRTNYRRLTSHKGGIWKKITVEWIVCESLSKVNIIYINKYYKTIK